MYVGYPKTHQLTQYSVLNISAPDITTGMISTAIQYACTLVIAFWSAAREMTQMRLKEALRPRQNIGYARIKPADKPPPTESHLTEPFLSLQFAKKEIVSKSALDFQNTKRVVSALRQQSTLNGYAEGNKQSSNTSRH